MLNARIKLRGDELFCADAGQGGASTARQLISETPLACAAGESAMMR
jgi:hypothetical protein